MTSFKDILDPQHKSEHKRLYRSYILKLFGAVSAGAVVAALGPISIVKLAKEITRLHKKERDKLNQALRRMERHGLAKRQKRDDGNEYLLLTDAGQQAYKQEKLRDLTLKRPSVWDKKWRIVIFEIKEDKKTVRDALRKHLRNLDFYQLQKSVFVTPYPCEEEIDFLQEFYEADSEICLISATSLGQKEEAVKKKFRL